MKKIFFITIFLIFILKSNFLEVKGSLIIGESIYKIGPSDALYPCSIFGNNKLYIFAELEDSILVFDYNSNKIIKTININSYLSFTKHSIDATYNVKQNKLYLLADCSLIIIDGLVDEIKTGFRFGIDYCNSTVIEYITRVGEYNNTLLNGFIYYNELNNKIYIPTLNVHIKNDTVLNYFGQLLILNGTNYNIITKLNNTGSDVIFDYKKNLVYCYRHYGDEKIGYNASIDIIDGETNRIIKTYDFHPFITLITNPFTNQIYAIKAFSNNIYEVNANNMTLGKQQFKNLDGYLIFGKNNFTYVINSNNLIIFDKNLNKIYNKSILLEDPVQFLYDIKSNRIYVLHGPNSSMTEIKILDLFKISVRTEPLNVSVIPGNEWYELGTLITTGTAPTVINGEFGTRYIFSGWILNGTSQSENPISITVNATYEAVAKYKTQHYLTVRSDYGNPQGEGWYDEGSTATFSITSPVGGIGAQQIFINWSVDSEETTTTATVLMDTSKTVYAKWRTDYTQIYVIGTGIVVTLVVITVILTYLRKNRQTN